MKATEKTNRLWQIRTALLLLFVFAFLCATPSKAQEEHTTAKITFFETLKDFHLNTR